MARGESIRVRKTEIYGFQSGFAGVRAWHKFANYHHRARIVGAASENFVAAITPCQAPNLMDITLTLQITGPPEPPFAQYILRATLILGMSNI